MKARLKKLIQRLPGLSHAFEETHEQQRQNADGLLISMPSCGRTWLRFAMGRSFQREFGFEEVNPFDVYTFGKKHPAIPKVKPLHETFGSPDFYREKLVIVLVRDPRDVLVSNYFGSKKRGDFLKSEYRQHTDTIKDFIKNTDYLDEVIHFYNSWYAHRDVPKEFTIVRYEDMKADMPAQLDRLMNFLGVKVARKNLEEAANDADFENMRKLEKEGTYRILRARNPEDRESYKTRKGRAGGYRDHLDEEDIAYIETELENRLEPFYGYNYRTS
ncbi:hypothetical protein AY599_18710 [Leptolyngbya valderiana BDU 20041]|nr:hypothetical protein AY599_18710 [Leptolyngbya valderiana BDU 20041]